MIMEVVMINRRLHRIGFHAFIVHYPINTAGRVINTNNGRTYTLGYVNRMLKNSIRAVVPKDKLAFLVYSYSLTVRSVGMEFNISNFKDACKARTAVRRTFKKLGLRGKVVVYKDKWVDCRPLN